MVQLDFDPERLSYAELVKLVWANRRGGRSYGRHQYMEAIFCADEREEAIAREVNPAIPIVGGAPFYRAEDYHQKYYLRHDRVLMQELAGCTPRDFVDSTIAARLNGYVARRGTREQLRGEIASFGLSPGARAHLEQLVTR